MIKPKLSAYERVDYNCHDRELKMIFILIFVLKVAVNPQTGISRGFAFVDYGTAEEAERGQKAHNGALLEGTNIRVAYGTPGRTGASILGGQNTNVVRTIFKILVSVCGMTNSLRYNFMFCLSCHREASHHLALVLGALLLMHPKALI